MIAVVLPTKKCFCKNKRSGFLSDMNKYITVNQNRLRTNLSKQVEIQVPDCDSNRIFTHFLLHISIKFLVIYELYVQIYEHLALSVSTGSDYCVHGRSYMQPNRTTQKGSPFPVIKTNSQSIKHITLIDLPHSPFITDLCGSV